jgi:hypothetical protein
MLFVDVIIHKKEFSEDDNILAERNRRSHTEGSDYKCQETLTFKESLR